MHTAYLSEEQDERGEVEDVDHAHQPMEEHGGAGGGVKTLQTVLQSGIKHLLQHKSTHTLLFKYSIFAFNTNEIFSHITYFHPKILRSGTICTMNLLVGLKTLNPPDYLPAFI